MQSDSWYDLAVTTESDPHFEQQLAGYFETSKPSKTDPALDIPPKEAGTDVATSY
jgi:hypothetical protein